MQRLSELTVGRWHGLLPQLGIDASALTGRHGPCPLCGGRDRFRFDNREARGTWICNQCGAGDGIALVMNRNGWTFRQAAEEIERLVGHLEPRAAQATEPEPDHRQALRRLWAASRPVEKGDVVHAYLTGRLGALVVPPCLRTVEHMRYQDPGGKPSFYPGMLALVSDVEGRPVHLHRTYLTAGGRKAGVPSPRKLMPGSMPKGAAVRLTPAADTLGIAEGIETALAATALTGIPCWSAVNANLLANWAPPEGVQRVVVFADNDASFAGQSAAFALAHTLTCRRYISVEARVPPMQDTDWVDVLAERLQRNETDKQHHT